MTVSESLFKIHFLFRLIDVVINLQKHSDCVMSGKLKNASVSNESDAEVGKMHLMNCGGTGYDSKPCPVWTQVWLPRKFCKRIETKPICAVCVVQEKQCMDPQRAMYPRNFL